MDRCVVSTNDAASLRAGRPAFQARADAERQLADAVSVARTEGHSWARSTRWPTRLW